MKDEQSSDELQHNGGDQDCIEACTACSQTCLQMAMTHCLEMGGAHAEPSHMRLMLDCAAVCELAARLQLGASEFADDFCALCAEVCLACADSCDGLEGMEDCAQTCRDCAAQCETRSGMAS